MQGSPEITPARVIIESLRGGRTVRFAARGSSMWPRVRAGARLRATPCRAGDLARGDLAVYCSGQAVVVHRVEVPGSAAVLCRGDRRSPPFERVPAGDVLGKAVVESQPPLRWRRPGVADVRLLAKILASAALAAWQRRRGRFGPGSDGPR